MRVSPIGVAGRTMSPVIIGKENAALRMKTEPSQRDCGVSTAGARIALEAAWLIHVDRESIWMHLPALGSSEIIRKHCGGRKSYRPIARITVNYRNGFSTTKSTMMTTRTAGTSLIIR